MSIHIIVYRQGVSRTNIDLQDDLVLEVMQAFDLPTKRSSVEYASRRLLDARLSDADLDAMMGVGWEGDLDSLRADG